MKHEELPIFELWSKFLGWLLGITEKFPRRARFTFASRLDNLGLDVLETLVEASYSKNKIELLRRVNLDIEKMRVLIRICHEQKYLSTAAYKHAIHDLYEAGKMIGGWIKERQRK
jgi:hypothetical protein